MVAAYDAVAEALANTIKHARMGRKRCVLVSFSWHAKRFGDSKIWSDKAFRSRSHLACLQGISGSAILVL